MTTYPEGTTCWICGEPATDEFDDDPYCRACYERAYFWGDEDQ